MRTIIPYQRFLTVVSLLLSFCKGHSQPASLQFEHITSRDGLSQDIITCLYRDRLGFLWIGTEDGLNRYDGYSVVSYKHNPRDSTSLIYSRVSGICDYEGEDLLVTTNTGCSIYHRASNGFTRPGGHLAPFAAMGTARPLCDRRGRYWMILKSRTVLRYDPARDSVAVFDPLSATGASSGENIQDLTIDNDDSVWVTAEKSVSVFLGDDKGFLTYPLRYEHTDVVNLSTIKDLRGQIWMATRGGLFRYNRQRGIPVLVPLGFMMDGTRHTGDQFIGGLCWDHRGRLWIGGFNGLYCFNPATHTTTRYAHEAGDPMSLQSNRVYNLLLDSSNVLWVGTWRGGLSKTDLKRERFGHYHHSETTPMAGASNDIAAMIEQPPGTFWFASANGGLTRINFRANEFETFSNKRGNTLGFCDGDISSLTGDGAGSMWVAVNSKIACYDPTRKRFSTLSIPGNHEHNYSIQLLHTDRHGDLWMGVQEFGIVKYDPRTNHFTYFTKTNSGKLPITGAWLFFEDRAGNFWAGGWGGNGMLLRLNRDQNQFDEIPRSELQSARTAVEDPDGNLWIGTWGLGMSRYNPQTGSLQQYLEQDGLPSNFVKGILPDDRGNLWISTEKGLSRFTPSTRIFRNFSSGDGLQEDFFYTGSCLKGSDGRLYFGGVNGFNAFYPDSIRQEEYNPPVLLTEFRVFDHPRDFSRPLPLVEHIVLPYRDDMFSFEYVSLDFSSPRQNRYMYKLEGYDADWIQAGSRRYASYTHLDPGTYVFTVNGTNSDGRWSSRVASVELTITPAFWQTWWFRSGIVLLIGASLYMLYRYRVRKLLEIERTRALIATDLHDDIGSSLTTIALFSDLARREIDSDVAKARARLQRIADSSRSLLDRMNDIVWSINPENDGLEQTILRMEDYAVEMLEESGVDLHVQIPEQLKRLKLPMTVRKNLFLIFKEAISNVLKHAKATHVDVIISTAQSDKRTSDLLLSIVDNGCGFSRTVKRGGNGLGNMELRARNLNGAIDVISSDAMGTKVEIRFPIKSPI